MPRCAQTLLNSGHHSHPPFCSGGGTYTVDGTRARGAICATSSGISRMPLMYRSWVRLGGARGQGRGGGGR
jgi:hypothetical protein